MAHRFNSATGRVESKPSARERTWYRWRMRKGIAKKEDIERRSKFMEIKKKLDEVMISKLREIRSKIPV